MGAEAGAGAGPGLTLGELAVRLGCELDGDPDARVSGVATLQHAGPGQLSFLANPAYRQALAQTAATVVVLAAEDAGDCPTAALVHTNPYAAYARAAALLHPSPGFDAGVHPSAVVSAAAEIDPGASIGAHVTVEAGARIGAGVRLGPGCVVMQDSVIGAGSALVARVSVGPGVRVGERCLLHPGVVLGADGFGIAQDAGRWIKVPQVGGVVIGNDVEIGANTTIDRGAIGDTVIEDGVKLDNQIQVAHNVHIGAHTAIAAMVGIAGSTRIGSHCMIAGQAGIGGHLEICDRVVLIGRAMVTHSIREPGMYGSGIPVEEAREWRRGVARYRQLAKTGERLRRLERRLDKLTGEGPDRDSDD
ncbi:MAG: UDP-3-O-(3-hydroxymyristoyl)glucosamine N-acyltransferase [Gammaproteobacteria bacterium]|nr:MAG: UDP-3-O-(3-hydroxymyristoyl)glucosamine N-acyltransferase [Gammaproteobacteria bacterium]